MEKTPYDIIYARYVDAKIKLNKVNRDKVYLSKYINYLKKQLKVTEAKPIKNINND